MGPVHVEVRLQAQVCHKWNEPFELDGEDIEVGMPIPSCMLGD